MKSDEGLFWEVYNLCCLHFHRLTVHVNTRIVFFMKLLLLLLLLLLLNSSCRAVSLFLTNDFKTPISKRMLILCQIGNKNATTRTFLMWLLAPRGSVKESSGSFVVKSAGNCLFYER